MSKRKMSNQKQNKLQHHMAKTKTPQGGNKNLKWRH